VYTLLSPKDHTVPQRVLRQSHHRTHEMKSNQLIE
jgi:hypothetical protein